MRAFFISFALHLAILAASMLLAGALIGPTLALLCTCLAGFSAGCMMAAAPRSLAPLPQGLGALCAALVLSVPVILATYGFALLALPLLVVYAVCVGTGAYLVQQRAPDRT